MSNESNSTPTTDACPAWADKLIWKIREIEIRLGNLRPVDDSWSRLPIHDVWQRTFDEEATQNSEDEVESLFRQVAVGLSREGYSPDSIVQFINARVRDSGGLPYCDATEVTDALTS